MKRLGLLALLLLLVAPAWAAQKMTVEQLRALLAADHKAGKSDHDVAEELQNVELTEELTHNTINSMAADVPGQMTTEQLFVLEIRSAALTPPASDIAADPAPDPAAQKAILDKAAAFAQAYAQTPAVTATKVVRRFQDSVSQPTQSMAAKNNANFAAQVAPIHYTAADEQQVSFRNGVEQVAPPKEKTTWGLNGMIALLGQAPSLSAVLNEAQQAGKIAFTRWETVFGQKVAVFSFAVDKKKSHYALNYCCFPQVSQTGDIAMRGQETAGGAGNYQSIDQWKPWKATVPYHGELFVAPDTGAVVRLIVQADLKGSDPVRVETQRIDYGPQNVAGKSLTLPVQTLIDTVEQPYPDSPSGRFIMRHTLFAEDYKDYNAGS